MKNEDIITEVKSLLDFIDESRGKISLEHDKFQIALTNTLRLLEDGSPIITKMKGSPDDLKAFLVRKSTEIRQTSLDPFDQLRIKVESIRSLVQSP